MTQGVARIESYPRSRREEQPDRGRGAIRAPASVSSPNRKSVRAPATVSSPIGELSVPLQT